MTLTPQNEINAKPFLWLCTIYVYGAYQKERAWLSFTQQRYLKPPDFLLNEFFLHHQKQQQKKI